MAVWEDKRIASICSQMPNLTIMATNAAAAVDQTRLSQSDRALLARTPKKPAATIAPDAAVSVRKRLAKSADKRCHALPHVLRIPTRI
jgi:hypothetical protein